MSNKVIIKNGEGAPTAEALGKAELGFDTLHELVFIGRENNDPLCISPEVKIDLDGAELGQPSLLNADSLGGRLASEYATLKYVSDAIKGASIGGGEPVDLSEYAKKEEIPDVSSFQTAEQVSSLINEALGVIENGSY